MTREIKLPQLRVDYGDQWAVAIANAMKDYAIAAVLADREVQQDFRPVAEVVECKVNGQQTIAEIDGRWKFLKYGDKLYAHGAFQ